MTRSDDTPVPDYQSMLRLDGRRFVLIGAGQGIGRQAAHALSGAGTRVLCVDVDEGLAQDIAEEVGGVPWSGDATNRDEVERMFADATAALGGVDGVVDIVGIARFIELPDVTDDDWEWFFSMNLRHAFLAMQIGFARDDRRRCVRVRDVGLRAHVRATPRAVRGGESRAHVVGAHGRRRARPQGDPGQLGVAGRRVDTRVGGMLGDAGKASQSRNAPLGDVAYPSDIAAGLLFFASDLFALHHRADALDRRWRVGEVPLRHGQRVS